MQIYSWDKAGFETAYSRHFYKLRGCGAAHRKSCPCTDTLITYSRTFFEEDNIFKLRADKLDAVLDTNAGTNVLVLGCALGFLMEELNSRGFNVWGVDNSQYIQSIKNLPANRTRLPIHNVSVLENNFVSEIKRMSKVNSFSAIITEDLLTSHDDFTGIINKCEQLLDADSPKTNIVHIVDLNTSPPFTVKTATQWRAIEPTHRWMDSFGNTI